jgi:diacylglycerol kinase (ATP)
MHARIRSFVFAWRGLGVLLHTQPNARIHAAASLLAFALGVWLQVTLADWLWLIVAMALVWISEAVNTALEFLADAAVPDSNPLIGQAKDVSAAGVLLAAIAAAAIGCIILGRPLLERLS